jgi:hypothetical protein
MSVQPYRAQFTALFIHIISPYHQTGRIYRRQVGVDIEFDRIERRIVCDIDPQVIIREVLICIIVVIVSCVIEILLDISQIHRLGWIEDIVGIQQ